MTDQDLLRQFVQDRSQSAFAELVRRHVDWVHSAALRRVRDPQLAEDVTQATFLVLAQKAAALQKHTVLAAWLFTVMTHVSAQVRKREATRRHHETQAAQAIQRMLQTQSSETVRQEWDQIVDVLDEVVGRLGRSDRQVVLLRFYQQKSFTQVAEVLGISEIAARKRASRAIEKLRAIFARKGFAIPATAITAAFLSKVTTPAPAAVVTVCSVAATTTAVEAAATLAKGAIAVMASVQNKMAMAKLALFLLFATVVVTVGQIASQTNSQTRKIASSGPAATMPMTEQVTRGTGQAANDPVRTALLKQIQELRAAVFQANRTGRGVAELEYVDFKDQGQMLHPGGAAVLRESLAPHRVNFIFSGSEFLVTGRDAFNSNARLVKDRQETKYFAGVSDFPAPPSVRIQPIPQPILWDANLGGWSFSYIAGFPPVLAAPDIGESTIFDRMALLPDVIGLQRDGQIVRISIDMGKMKSPNGDPTHATYLIELDLRVGGMMTHYHGEDVRQNGGRDLHVTEDWQMSWHEVNGHIVPKTRVAESRIIEDGKLNNGGRSRITFESFTIEPVDPEKELTIDRMGIPPGTRVADPVNHVDWVYPQKP